MVQELRDKNYKLLGTLDGTKKRDAQGRLVGKGNLLATLLTTGKG